MKQKTNYLLQTNKNIGAGISSLLFLFFIFNPCSALFGQNIQLLIRDCKTGKPLTEVHVVDRYNHELTKSNNSGHVQFPLKGFPVYFEKIGYDVLSIYDKKELTSQVCLHPKHTELQEVQVKAKKVNLEDLLIELRDKNIPLFTTHKTTYYYQFNYKLEFPEDNWQETASGYIAFQWRHHKTITPKVYYLTYNYDCTNKEFWNNPVYDSVHPLGIFHVFSYNLMGNYPGYKEIWRRMTNSESGGIRIPDWMLSKKQKAFLKELEAHPEKYKQYWKNGRTLRLRLDSNYDRVFNAYYDTTNYIMEQVVFDSLLRLKQVSYFTPEQLSSDGVPFDAEERKKTLNKSRLNNDGSYYHSIYLYDVLHNPIVLDSVNHISSFIVKGRSYISSLQLKRVDSVPHKSFKIRTLYGYETKGKDILKEIRRYKENNEDSKSE